MTTPAALTSVVIVTWNGREILSEALDSLAVQRGLRSPVEFLVVDNGSEDGTVEMLIDAYPNVRVLPLPRNLGFAAGANAGIAAARGDVVVLLNNDAVADPDFLQAARDALEADPTIGAVTGLILLADVFERGEPGDLVAADGTGWVRSVSGTQLVNSTGGEVTRSANGRDRDWLTPLSELHRTSGPVAGFSGGAVALRRAALDDVGLFDDRLFMYYEDSDLSWRLRRSGWRIEFEPKARVRHRHAASSGTGSEFFLFHNERNRLLFAIKHAPMGVVAAAVARTIAGALRGAVRRDVPTFARKLRALTSAAALAPKFARDRMKIDHTASITRSTLWSDAPRD